MDSQIGITPLWVANESTGIEMLLRNIPLNTAVFATAEQHNQSAEQLEIPFVNAWSNNWGDPNCWLIPEEYQNLDVVNWIVDRIPNCAVRQERAATELTMYQDRELFPVLKVMIYLVDTMREHGIVWGVGRGSSVSSYVLYLIGVHHIDSVKYNLDINEFLR
jgi:DNA polymerase III alpha subunit